MADTRIPVPADWAAKTRVNATAYAEMRRRAASDPASFFGEAAKRLEWISPFTEVKDVSFDAADLHIRWFGDGVLNVSANCIDRWLETRGDETAIIFEGDEPDVSQTITYARAAPACVPNGQRPEGQRRGKGRPCHALLADDPGSRLRHAGLRADRRGAFGGVRRLLARKPGGAHPGLRLQAGHHRRRGRARRQDDSAEGQRRYSAAELPRASIACWWSAARARPSRWPKGATCRIRSNTIRWRTIARQSR